MGKRTQTSLAAELFVAAELAKQGHLVTITFGKEKAIDLLVAKGGDPGKTLSIDVKGLKNPTDWALGNFAAKKKQPDIYIFCYLNKPNQRPEYYIVPTANVRKLLDYAKDKKSSWMDFNKVEKYKDKWELIWGKYENRR